MRAARACAAAAVLAVCGRAAVVVTPVHPAPGDLLPPDEFLVVAGVTVDAGENVAGAIVRLDGNRQSAGVTVADGVVTWVPPDAELLAGERFPGPHRVSVTVFGPDTAVLAAAEWDFTVLAPPKARSRVDSAAVTRRYRQSGLVYAEAGHYTLDGETEWEAGAGGIYRASYGKLRYGAEVRLTNLNADDTQDRNTYRADVSYGPWVTLRVGDTRPSYHPAILAGKRIRGLELNARGVLGNGVNIANLDMAWGQALRSARPDVYERTIFATQLSFGSGRVFRLGLTFLKGSDKPSSIRPPLDTLITIDSIALDTITPPNDTAWDTSLVEGAAPEQNAVAGVEAVGRIWGGRVELYGTFAFAVRTRDLNDSAITKAQLDEAMGVSTVDPAAFDWLITINQSSLPLSGGRGVLNSSHITGGLRLRFPMRMFTEEFDVGYKLQGANYSSMGNPLTGTGEQGIEIANRLYAMRNRLFLECTYGISWNNLDELQSSPTVNNRVGAGLSFFYSPRSPSLVVQYRYTQARNDDTTYGFINGVNAVTLLGTYAYHVGIARGTAQLFCNWSGIANDWQSVSFEEGAGAAARDTSSFFSTGVYGLNLLARLDGVPLEFTAGLSTNAGGREMLRMVNGWINARHRMLRDMLGLTVGMHLGASRMPGAPSYDFNIRVPYSAEFSWRRHGVRFAGYAAAEGADADLVNTLRYEWRF